MNSALIFGPKRRGEGLAKPSSMGGLYHFGTQEGGLSFAQVGAPRLSIGMINRAAQLITDVGCVPDTIVCGTGRALHSSPATNPSSDGERAKLIGEYTAEFKNAKQALCRISGLMNSALAITQ